MRSPSSKWRRKAHWLKYTLLLLVGIFTQPPISKRRIKSRWLKYTSLFLIGIFTQFLFTFSNPVVQPIQAQEGNSCAISTPLSPEDEAYARSAWNYFVDNTQPDTGFSNSAGGFPSGTLWDLGNYLAAMNAARWMGFIEQSEFDHRMNQFLATLGELRLFEDTLPNKVYNSATGEMVDYGNNPIDRGIGWSALDIGRVLAAFHIIRTCHPQYGDWMQGIIDSWNIEASLKDDMLYGAAVLPDDSTLPVQEGRLGYEEYAARGYQLWGYRADKALAYEPFEFVDIYGLQIPVDKRAFQETNANNYVVSESYILDAIEFGLSGEQADYARRVYEAQKRRYEDTGLLTAVSEDNINGPPYFLYSTVYSNGVPWAVITENNELYPEMRTLSTKAAIGWHIVYPDEPYAKQLFDRVKDACNSGRGYFAGIFESKLSEPPPAPDAPYEVAKEYYNNILTGNTNGIITEMFYYKARGNRPLIGGGTAAPAPAQPVAVAAPEPLPPPADPAPVTTAPDNPLSPPPVPAEPEPVAIAPAPEPSPPPEPAPEPTPIPVTLADQDLEGREIALLPPVGSPQKASCPVPRQDLSVTDERYARNAWKYFEANYHPTGLVDDRSDLDGTTMWGVGDYLSALHAAQSLDVITPETFDKRVRHALASLREMDLFDGELPHRAYNTNTLEPIDYGGNADVEGGWSGLDMGRVLAALHTLKTCHPEYTDVVDQVVLDWSYLRVVRNGRLGNAVMEADDRGRSRLRVYPTPFLGYEEYAARGFQLWGFDVGRSAVGEQYETEKVEGQAVPVRSTRHRDNPDEILNTVSNPFILYGLEFGFDPEMRSLVDAIFHAEEARYQRTGTFSASGTTLIDQEPYVVHSTLVSNGQDWQAVTDDGQTLANKRVVSTAIAFAYYTLFPESDYSQDLWRATLDLYNPVLGYYEGFYEDSGRTTLGFSSGTNSLILQALLHKVTDGQPLIQPHRNLRSAWWDAVEDGYSGQGLPEAKTIPIQMTTANGEQYWMSSDQAVNPAPIATPDAANDPLSIENRSPDQSSMLENGASAVSIANPTVELIANRDPPDASSRVISTEVRDREIKLLSERDRTAAQRAWMYFQNNRQPDTGMVNAVDQLAWTTLWDQGSAILAIHAGYQLDLLSTDDFHQWMDTLLHTLNTQPLPTVRLPNKAYSTATGEMRTLTNQSDPDGTSGWSALDIARYLLSLKVIATYYPEYGDRITHILARYDLDNLVQEGWLIGGHPSENGEMQRLQEGRLGYEQYAAHSLNQWDIEATNALYHPPTKTVNVDGFSFDVDQRNLDTSGASNYLTSDPYTLWGLELGWPDSIHPQVDHLLDIQKRRFDTTGILTAVNEDSLDRPPHFLYYSVYANGEPWSIVTPWGTSHPDLRFLSTKASFSWNALKPDEPYTIQLRNTVQNLADTSRGYLSGRYENPELGNNHSIDINTNAIVLESLLYKTEHQPLLHQLV